MPSACSRRVHAWTRARWRPGDSTDTTASAFGVTRASCAFGDRGMLDMNGFGSRDRPRTVPRNPHSDSGGRPWPLCGMQQYPEALFAATVKYARPARSRMREQSDAPHRPIPPEVSTSASPTVRANLQTHPPRYAAHRDATTSSNACISASTECWHDPEEFEPRAVPRPAQATA